MSHIHGKQRRFHHPHRAEDNASTQKPLAPQFMPDDQSLQDSPELSPFTDFNPTTSKTGDSSSDDFLVIERECHLRPGAPVGRFIEHNSGVATNCDFFLRGVLKKQYPHLIMTVCKDRYCDILSFAALGKVDLKPNTRKDLSFLTQSVFFPSAHRSDGPGTVHPTLDFGCFDVTTKSGHKFIHYYARYVEDFSVKVTNFFLHDQQSKAAVQGLLLDICSWGAELHDEILVFQGGWLKDHQLWEAIQKANWDDVILDEEMKKEVIGDVDSFFASREIYGGLGVPWKRGLIFHGPPGNGKTISIKALMKNLPHPSLYVKSFHTWAGDEVGIKMIFERARAMAPCLLILEDIDSLIDQGNRSFFLNEVDGLSENDGILVLATTNHLELLDPGIVNRPSRFDRKYFFPLPSEEERKKYCQYWKHKLESNDKIDFPDSLVDKIAEWTNDFSFAYLKEAFVSSLLIIAARNSHRKGNKDKKDESFETIIKRQIETLKKEMGDGSNVELSKLKV